MSVVGQAMRSEQCFVSTEAGLENKTMSYQKRARISDQNNVLSAVGRQDRKTEQHVLLVVVGRALKTEHCLVSRGAGSENRTMSCQQWGSKLGEQTVTSCEGVQMKTMTIM